ncbi:uncharacterized protein PFL1_05429 [Pseudozyma flocculosa PF-1]|uniref:Uncharacterized protein n=2 Tax=Pseudozyma flocculosa TaxID=84751 RepID=A0A5C3FCS2_9BASI|nr:uncharacterized protein PFL1_05429 [Pseudozyma flocculosa PF-1]EPQ27148.1 hypothetical protein PFL1_05429 [Pseudozyma flocculosa PF-1]SPO41271.1 uncharacterized protein PSFLO_06753 [Pseudozyma flocculosa]
MKLAALFTIVPLLIGSASAVLHTIALDHTPAYTLGGLFKYDTDLKNFCFVANKAADASDQSRWELFYKNTGIQAGGMYNQCGGFPGAPDGNLVNLEMSYRNLIASNKAIPGSRLVFTDGNGRNIGTADLSNMKWT